MCKLVIFLIALCVVEVEDITEKPLRNGVMMYSA